MNAEDTLRQLTASLAQGVQELAQKRNDTDSSLKYAELTGRMDTMTTIINFIQQSIQAATPAEAVEAEPKKAKPKKAKGTKEEK